MHTGRAKTQKLKIALKNIKVGCQLSYRLVLSGLYSFPYFPVGSYFVQIVLFRRVVQIIMTINFYIRNTAYVCTDCVLLQ